MELKVNISPVEMSDVSAIAQCHCDVWLETYRGIIPENILNAKTNVEERKVAWNRVISKNDDTMVSLKASIGDDLAGFIGGGKPRDALGIFDCELWGVNILKKFHKQGVGRALIEHFFVWLKKQGYQESYLWVAQENKNAISFYLRMGWKKTDYKKMELGAPHVALSRRV